MLSALFGGVLMGSRHRPRVFIGNGTTGGTDMMAALIRKARHYSVTGVMRVLDGIIVIAGFFLLRYPRFAPYAICGNLSATKVTDALMEGMNYAKSAFIITAHPEQVADELMEELSDRGASGIHIRECTRAKKRMMVFLLCCGQKQIPAQTDRRNDRSGRVCRCVRMQEVLGEGLPDRFLLTFLRIFVV